MNNKSGSAQFFTGMAPALQGILSGLVVTALLVFVYQLSMRLGLPDSQNMIDDIVGGLIAGLLVFIFATIRNRYVARRLEVIAAMNHHVRNALQVISYAQYIRSEPEQLAQMREAVQRIDWALREVLSRGSGQGSIQAPPPADLSKTA
ncbi:MAG: hypothetical protein JO041_06935 [Acidobacteria bacterium]|nr:hypothetical protein [Acidobacteriota bacterium]